MLYFCFSIFSNILISSYKSYYPIVTVIHRWGRKLPGDLCPNATDTMLSEDKLKKLIFSFFCFQAFVHDPLINWRLFNFNEVPQMSMFANTHAPAVVNTEESTQNRGELPQPQRGARERELLQVFGYPPARRIF